METFTGFILSTHRLKQYQEMREEALTSPLSRFFAEYIPDSFCPPNKMYLLDNGKVILVLDFEDPKDSTVKGLFSVLREHFSHLREALLDG